MYVHSHPLDTLLVRLLNNFQRLGKRGVFHRPCVEEELDIWLVVPGAKQSKAKQSKAKQRKAKQSKGRTVK